MTGEVVKIQSGDVASPQLLEVARRSLAEAETLPEISQLVDRAAVIQAAARRARLSQDAQNDWAEYKLDAERKAGRMLAEAPRAQIGRPAEKTFHDGTITPRAAPPRLEDLGITRKQSHHWQQIASLPDEDYEEYKASARAKGEVTESGALALAKRQARRSADIASTKPSETDTWQPALIEKASWVDWLPTQPNCDLLLTDPPYSTDVDDIEQFADEWLPAALGKVKATGRAYVCIGAYPSELRAYLNVPPPNGMTLANILVWTYRNTLGPAPTFDYKLNWQAILYYRGPDAPPLDCPLMVEQFTVQDLNAPDGRLGDRYHAWQKPATLAERLIRHSTKPGDLVLDPFAGTGTFVLTAARLGRTAAGCDRDPDMLTIAEERGCSYAS